MSFSPESEEAQFVQLIKKELSFKTSEEVVPRIIAVLRTFRETLSEQQATVIVNELPDYFKIAFITDWHYSEQHVKIDYLDQFVDLLLSRDKQKLFKSEVEALSVSILVFKKLIELCDQYTKSRLTIFSPSVFQEINTVPSEGAAA